MSVSQVKKKFEEMSQYLNRDAEGQKRLKELKDAVNVLRTSLAEANKAVETSDAIRENARLRADAAEAEARRYASENETLRSKLASRDATIQQLTATIHDLEAGPEEFRKYKDSREGTAPRLLSNIRKVHRTCPRLVRFTQVKEKGSALYIEDFVSTWSYQELWSLGAVVALFAMLGESVLAIRRYEYPTDKLPTFRDKAESIFGSERAAAYFRDWFRKNLADEADMTDQQVFDWSKRETLMNTPQASVVPQPELIDTVSVLFPEDES